MGELRRSIAILYGHTVLLDVGCQKYISFFMWVLVGLTTVDKLAVFTKIFAVFLI